MKRVTLNIIVSLGILAACGSPQHGSARALHSSDPSVSVPFQLQLPPGALPSSAKLTVQAMSEPGEPLRVVDSTGGMVSVRLGRGHHHVIARLPGYAPRVAAVDVDEQGAIPPRLVIRFDSGPTRPAPTEARAAEWFKAAAIPLPLTASQLMTTAGQAQVVGLGEAAHGAEELASVRAMVAQQLLASGQFRALLVEGSYPDSLLVDRYIGGVDGEGKAVLRELGAWQLNSAVMLGLVEWMRRFNRGREARDHVHFIGVDNQRPKRSAERVLQLNRSARAVEIAPFLASSFYDTFQSLTVNKRSELGESLDRLTKAAESVDASVRDEYLFHVDLLRQLLLDAGGRPGYRDQAMARNVATVLQSLGTGSRAIVWAHNFHISHDGNQFEPGMGTALRQRFGDGYVSIGTTFGRGRVAAWNGDLAPTATQALESFSVGVPKGPEAVFEAASPSAAVILDLSVAPDDIAAWLHQPLPVHDIGTRYFTDTHGEADVDLYAAFDRLIYVARVSSLQTSNP